MSNALEQPVKAKKETGFRINPTHINKHGRPLNPEKRDLQNALRAVKRNHNNVEFLHHIADQAYSNTTVAMKVLDKLIPNAENPKENDNSGFKQLIIVRTDSNQTEEVSRPICVQPEEVSRSMEQLGNGEDNGSDTSEYVIQRASEE